MPPMNTNIRIFDPNYPNNFSAYYQNLQQPMELPFPPPYMTTQALVHPTFVNIPSSADSKNLFVSDSTSLLPNAVSQTSMLSINGMLAAMPPPGLIPYPSVAMTSSTSFVTGHLLTDLDINAQIKKQMLVFTKFILIFLVNIIFQLKIYLKMFFYGNKWHQMVICLFKLLLIFHALKV